MVLFENTTPHTCVIFVDDRIVTIKKLGPLVQNKNRYS